MKRSEETKKKYSEKCVECKKRKEEKKSKITDDDQLNEEFLLSRCEDGRRGLVWLTKLYTYILTIASAPPLATYGLFGWKAILCMDSSCFFRCEVIS